MVWLLVVLCIGLCLWCGYALGSGSLLPLAFRKRKGQETPQEVSTTTKEPALSKMDLMKELVDDLIEAQNELRDLWDDHGFKPVDNDFFKRLEVTEHHYNQAYEKLLAAIKREIE